MGSFTKRRRALDGESGSTCLIAKPVGPAVSVRTFTEFRLPDAFPVGILVHFVLSALISDFPISDLPLAEAVETLAVVRTGTGPSPAELFCEGPASSQDKTFCKYE